MRPFQSLSLTAVSCIAVVLAHAQETRPAVEIGARIWGAQGDARTGHGGGGGLDARWKTRHDGWLALHADVGVSYLGAVDFPAQQGGFRADATTAFAVAGPEVSRKVFRGRVYAGAVAGLIVIRSTSTYTPFDYTYDWDSVIDKTWIVGIGGGVRYPISTRLTLDLGTRAESTGNTTWARDPQGSIDGSSAMPPIRYTRRLHARVWHLGVQLVP